MPPQKLPYLSKTVRLFFSIFVIISVAMPCAVAAASRFSAEGRINTGWEYDDNVFESSSGKTNGGAAITSLFTTFKLGSSNALTVLNYNLGYKDHHGLGDSGSLVAGDVLVNRLNVLSRRRLAGSWMMGYGGDIKYRNVYDKNELNLLSEEGYFRGSGQLNATRLKLAGQVDLRLEYRLSFCNFQTFKTFDYISHNPGVQLSRRLGQSSAVSLGYTYTRRRFDRLINVPDGSGGLAQGDSRQSDNLHQLELGLSYTRGMLFNISWALLRNDSNNYGFSYWNNRFTVFFADRLPGRLFLNAYLFFRA